MADAERAWWKLLAALVVRLRKIVDKDRWDLCLLISFEYNSGVVMERVSCS